MVTGFFPLTNGPHRGAGPLVASFSGHTGWVKALGISPDGQVAVSAAGRTATVWETVSGRITGRLVGHSGDITGLAIDGRRAVSSSEDNTLRVWDLTDGKVILRQDHEASVVALRIDPPTGRIICLAKDGSLRIWQIDTGQSVHHHLNSSLLGPTGATFTCLDLVAGNDVGVIGDDSGSITIFDFGAARQVASLSGGRAVRAVAAHPGGEYVAAIISGSFEGDRIQVWNLTTQELTAQFGGREDFFDDLAFSATGSRLLVASFPKPRMEQQLGSWQARPTPIQVWKFTPPDNVGFAYPLEGHAGGAWILARAGARDVFLSYGYEKLVRVWDLGRVVESTEPRGAGDASASDPRCGQFGTVNITSVADNDGSTFAVTVSECGMIRVWNVGTGDLVRTVTRYCKRVRMQPPPCLVAVPGCTFVIVSYERSHGSGLMEFNWQTGEVVREIDVGTITDVHGDAEVLISSMVLTPGGLLIASCFFDELLVWSYANGRRLAVIRGGNPQPLAPNLIHERYPIALFPDGRRLIWGNTECELQIVDFTTGQTLSQTEPHEEISDLKVLPDGRHVLTSAYSKGLFLWDLAAGTRIREFKKHTGSVGGIAVTNDGEYAVSCSEDMTLRAWHLPTGRNVTTLRINAMPSSCSISPDERTVIVGNRSGGVDFVQWRR